MPLPTPCAAAPSHRSCRPHHRPLPRHRPLFAAAIALAALTIALCLRPSSPSLTHHRYHRRPRRRCLPSSPSPSLLPPSLLPSSSLRTPVDGWLLHSPPAPRSLSRGVSRENSLARSLATSDLVAEGRPNPNQPNPARRSPRLNPTGPDPHRPNPTQLHPTQPNPTQPASQPDPTRPDPN